MAKAGQTRKRLADFTGKPAIPGTFTKMIQFRLDNRYISELDRLLKERRKQYPATGYRTGKPAATDPVKRPPETLPFRLKGRPGKPPKSSH